VRSIICLAISAVVALTGCSSSPHLGGVSGWIAENAVPVPDLGTAARGANDFRRAFDSARVVGLGEATHGQHESFEIKRAITMHLIRAHGYRIVAYEASASKAAACDAYISGASDDLSAAMRGFGMLIWSIEENAELLRTLRAWNERVPPEQRVRFVGIDVQDAKACGARLAGLLGERWASEAAAVRSISDRVDGTVQAMFGGDRTAYDSLVRESIELVDRVRNSLAQSPPPETVMAELRFGLREFEGSVQMYLTNGRRDRAMADMMLGVLDDSGPEAKAVLWAHNGHVTKSPLRYMGSDELAAGAHLAKALGEKYYAIGFAFGSGEFVANDLAEGKWIFRTYVVDDPPAGSLESSFMPGVHKPSVIDLRRDSGVEEIEQWKLAGHGQRWFGGYKVPENVREISSDVSKLMPTYPREAFDALLFLPQTRASTPRG
jgi:erythromycin esterase